MLEGPREPGCAPLPASAPRGAERRGRAGGAARGAGLALALALAASPVAASGSEGAPAARSAAEGEPGSTSAPARRVVSLNPSLTAILVAIGAEEALVGVDAWSAKSVGAVADLPAVGSLFSPSLEAVAAVRPDLVVLVPSAEQRGFRERLRELGVPVLALDPLGFDEVLATILELGRRVGAEASARERVAAIRAARRRVQRAARGLPRPRAVLVLQRDPLYVVAGGSFVHEMIEAAGARNVAAGAGFEEAYPRVSREWLLAAEPEVLLDSTRSPAGAAAYWEQWPSLPAVQEGRVVGIEEGVATLPGPWLDRGLRRLAVAIHGEAMRERLAARGEGAAGAAAAAGP